jgi:hypothetical protein
MASGLIETPVKMSGIVAMIDDANPVPAGRGPYNKRNGPEISN